MSPASRSVSRPVVGIPCDFRHIDSHPNHLVAEEYVEAATEMAGALPLLVPVANPPLNIPEVLAVCDGFIVTGSSSNVNPAHYGHELRFESKRLDLQRDATTLKLIPEAVKAGKPLLAICRGFQELNVVYGGTLHQRLNEVPSEEGYAPRIDHLGDTSGPVEQQYRLRHDVTPEPGGFFEKLNGPGPFRVNSIHGQGVDDLGPGLVLEARAPDGQIEAARVKDAAAFAVGVQWHPEWCPEEDIPSERLFAAFGEALQKAKAAR